MARAITCRFGSKFAALLLCRTHHLQNSMQGGGNAITLATELHAHRLFAIGTLGVLREAATLKLLDIRVAVERLQTTGFYIAPEVLASLLKDFA